MSPIVRAGAGAKSGQWVRKRPHSTPFSLRSPLSLPWQDLESCPPCMRWDRESKDFLEVRGGGGRSLASGTFWGPQVGRAWEWAGKPGQLRDGLCCGPRVPGPW